MIVYIHRSSISISMKVSLGGSSIANVGFKVSSGRTMLLLLFQETIILEVVFDSLGDSNFQLLPGSFTNHHHQMSSTHHQMSLSSIIRCHRLIAKTIQGLQKMRAVWNWNSNSGRDPHQIIIIKPAVHWMDSIPIEIISSHKQSKTNLFPMDFSHTV